MSVYIIVLWCVLLFVCVFLCLLGVCDVFLLVIGSGIQASRAKCSLWRGINSWNCLLISRSLDVIYIYVFLIQILGIFTFCMNVCWVRDHHDSKSSFLYLGNLCNYDQHFTASFFFQKAVIPWPYLWHLNIWE